MKNSMLPEGWSRPQAEDEIDNRHFEFIDEHGWALMSVFDPNGVEPRFTYSTGFIETLQQPELIVIGLPAETCTWLLNDLGAHYRAGKTLQVDQPIDGIAREFSIRLIDADTDRPEVFSEYLCWSHWYYGHRNFPVRQLVWPDEDGRFPWEPGTSDGFRKQQPLLGNLKS